MFNMCTLLRLRSCLLLIMYNQTNATTFLKCKVELLFIYKTCSNVSLEVVYVGWDSGDHHSDNFKAILDYNLS
jgi:hypothetical protein